MKLKTLLSSLQKAQLLLGLIEQAGIDVDRLIAISNAQGPQGRMLKDALAEAINIPTNDLAPVSSETGTKNKSTKRKALKG
jgi:hypothetical protein